MYYQAGRHVHVVLDYTGVMPLGKVGHLLLAVHVKQTIIGLHPQFDQQKDEPI
jgi:hypothetical protein